MSKEKNSHKNRGIEPKYWHLIPTDIEFGSLTDYYGGRANASEKEREQREGRIDTLRETSVGLVEYHASERGFNLLSERLGIGLFYQNDGRLSDVGIDITNYLLSCTEEDYESMGGDAMIGFLRALKHSDEQMVVSLDIDNKNVVIVGIDKKTGIGTSLFEATKHNFSLSTVADIYYDDYVANVGFWVKEDVLNFGIVVRRKDEGDQVKKKMMMMNILTDCNYKTFLESSSPDKYDNLVKRVFLLNN